MRYFPLFMDLAGRPCLVVGAGAVAARKARSLFDCGARVTVVGVRPVAAFRALERRGVVVRDRRFRASDVGRQVLIIAATDDRAVNAAVAAAARRKRIPVNAVDDPEHCSFIVPAVVTRGDLTVAISTGGRSPVAARLVKELISGVLGDEYAALVRLLGAHRGRMKDAVAGQGSRARAWQRMIDAGVLEALRRGDRKGAAETVRRCLADAACSSEESEPEKLSARTGRRGGAEGRSPARGPKGARRRSAATGPRSPHGDAVHPKRSEPGVSRR
ncbi:MAG: precorrin-2 dehydrogenase/sirohydrochlorin ferrochelatase family protein [Candidatus Methylomirabilia bacterium]